MVNKLNTAKTLIAIIIGGVSLVLIVIFFLIFIYSKEGMQYDEFIVSGNNFDIIVKANHEETFFMPGGFIHYYCKIKNYNIMQEVLIFRHDDAIEIPRDQIRFIDDNICCFFIGWNYCVTIDGGKNWKVSNILKVLPSIERVNYKLIKDVMLDKNGKGTMILKPIRIKNSELFTSDYGITWTAKE